MKNIKINNKSTSIILDISFGLILPFVFVYMLLLPLMSHSGFIFYGDTDWTFYARPNTVFNTAIFSWYHYQTYSINMYQQLFQIPFLAVGNYFANHALVLILAYLPGISSYFSIKSTLKLFYEKGTNIVLSSSAFIGSFFYLVNFQNPGLTNPTLSWTISYIIMPILLYLGLKLFINGSLRDAILFGAVGSFADAFPSWIIFSVIIIIVVLFYSFTRAHHKFNYLKHVAFILSVVLISIIAFSAYAILPSIYGITLGAGGNYTYYASSSQQVAVARFLSFNNFFHVISFSQGTFYFYGLNPDTFSLINIAFPLIAIFSIPLSFIYNKSINNSAKDMVGKNELFNLSTILVSILLLSAFIAKGVNAPFGEVYILLVEFSPPGLVGIIRDVTPFMEMVSLSYAFLISTVAFHCLNLLFTSKTKSTLSSRFERKRVIAVILLVLLILSSFAAVNGSWKVLKQDTYSRYQPTDLPEFYKQTLSEISALKPTGNVMWIPTGTEYSWKNNYSYPLTLWGPNLYQNSTLPNYIYPALFNNQTSDIGKLLSLTNTQYIIFDSSGSIYPSWPINYSSEYILSLLEKQNDLKLVYNNSENWIFRNLENVSTIYSGIPDYFNFGYSLFNVNKYISDESNLYVNSSSIYELYYYLGLLKYQSEVNNSSNSGMMEIPENESGLLIYNLEETSYAYNSSVYREISIVKQENILNISLRYWIPGYLYNYTKYNGKFYSGLFPEISIYSSGTYPVGGNKPLYYQFFTNSSQQSDFNRTSGIVSFDVPYTNNISIYASFHGAFYSTISPDYYIGSIINNNFVKIPLNETRVFPQNFQLKTADEEANISPYIHITNNPTIRNGTFSYSAIYIQPTLLENISFSPLLNASTIASHSNIIPELSYSIKNGSDIPVSNMSNLSNQIYPNEILNLSDEDLFFKSQTPFENLSYDLYINVIRGNITIGSSNYSKGHYSLPIVFRSGTYNFTIKVKNNDSCLMQIKIEHYNVYTNSTINDFIKHSPVYYSGHYSSNTSSLIVFPQNYNNQWMLEFNGSVYSGISLYEGSAMGFMLPSGYGNFSIYYGMQKYQNYGITITIVSWALILPLSYSSLRFKHKKKNGKNKF